MTGEVTCDKGPILDQLLESVGELRLDQRRMVDALVDIAKHQERLVALADRTTENRRDIDTLFTMIRENDANLMNGLRDLDGRVTNHLVNHPKPETCVAPPLLKKPDGKFDTIQVAVILSLIYFMANQFWGIISSLVTAANQAAGR